MDLQAAENGLLEAHEQEQAAAMNLSLFVY
jgi:hypothetical protein